MYTHSKCFVADAVRVCIKIKFLIANQRESEGTQSGHFSSPIWKKL